LFCRHSHTKTKSPQTNGICERFHQTAFNEFYRVAFRKNVYRSPTSCRRIWLVDQSPMPHRRRLQGAGLDGDGAAQVIIYDAAMRFVFNTVREIKYQNLHPPQ
jgi:hypothetical protein